MKIDYFITPTYIKKHRLPFCSASIAAGFPSPADDYVEKRLDLNDLVIKNPTATFFVRAAGDSMRDAGIQSGDILVVDRAITPVSGKIVVAVIEGEFTVKRLLKKEKEIYLMAEHPHFPVLRINPETDFQIWGVVTFVIHQTS